MSLKRKLLAACALTVVCFTTACSSGTDYSAKKCDTCDKDATWKITIDFGGTMYLCDDCLNTSGFTDGYGCTVEHL